MTNANKKSIQLNFDDRKKIIINFESFNIKFLFVEYKNNGNKSVYKFCIQLIQKINLSILANISIYDLPGIDHNIIVTWATKTTKILQNIIGNCRWMSI